MAHLTIRPHELILNIGTNTNSIVMGLTVKGLDNILNEFGRQEIELQNDTNMARIG